MAFFGNIVRSLLSGVQVPDTAVIEASTSDYARIQVVLRDECLVLYGPTNAKKYDLLLQTPINTGLKSFSLFRLSDSVEAQQQFLAVKKIILPLTHAIPNEIFNIALLEKLCKLCRDCPTWSAAHVAAHFGYIQAFSHPSVLKNANTEEIEHHLTPLHLAIEKCDQKIIRLLLQSGVDLSSKDDKGNSAYHYAAETNGPIIEILASQDIKLINAQNNAGKTPLYVACEKNKPDCVKGLLCAGADVNVAATHDSALPIHAAIQSDSMLCTKEIIAMHPNQLNAEDMKHGGTPLHWAMSRDMINALVELGCQINGKNFKGSTALHNMVEKDRLACVIAILSWGAEASLKNNDGNTPLHLARSLPVMQALVVFGADLDVTNNKGERPRHAISACDSHSKNGMIYCLQCIGASRCSVTLSTCSDGCSPSGKFDGVPPITKFSSRQRNHVDEYLDDAMNPSSNPLGFGHFGKKGRLLCLDGGGMKGLVLIQLLMIIEQLAGKPIKMLFDGICGTSTGGILALALAAGKSPAYCLGLYFRLKDQVFVGQRPYDEKPLEEILKKEFGEETRMSEISDIKVAVTGVLADRFPADLHLFRNYSGAEDLLNAQMNSQSFAETLHFTSQPIWQAARSSGAAPSYFRSYGRFIDGGLIANNPTLDFMTDIAERNTALQTLNRSDEQDPITMVLSLGTGKLPVSEVRVIDMFNPDSFFKTIQLAFGLSNMAKLLIDQATMSDNRTVDRARAWCSMCSIPYFRLSPQLSLDIPLDETRDVILVNMLWETRSYAFSKLKTFERIVQLLA